MLSMPIGPRRVNDLRRVTIPTREASTVGIAPDSWVVVSADKRDDGVLVIRPARGSARSYGIRDPKRARRVSDTGQVTLPAALLNGSGIEVGGFVAFTCTRTGLRVFSADRVRGPERRSA